MKSSTSSPIDRPWGIAVHMPTGDPMAAAHLLGEEWASHRWYATQADRDRALVDMQAQPPWYRRGDTPSVRLEKIDP